jgi:hypothetical protein
MKGIYPHGKGYRVRKYGAHLGCYLTYEEALKVATEAQEYRELEPYHKSKKSMGKVCIDKKRAETKVEVLGRAREVCMRSGGIK